VHGDAKYLIRFLGGTDKRFVIPVYQRNYAWKIPQCQRLYDDLVKVIKMNRENHFLGSIVSFYNPDSYAQEYVIIDGQQRLTTISIILLALYNLLKKGTVASKDNKLAQKIYEEYLIDKYQPEETKIKLKPIQEDKQAFQALFDAKKDTIESSDITANYAFFKDKIKWGELSADQLFESIRRIIIIDISLNHNDNPQLIFESLNSTGLELEEGDKIRNYVFMGIPPQKQTLYYKKYWSVIEQHTKHYLSDFLRHYLSVKQQKIPTIKKVYIAFKEYVEQKTDGNIEQILKDMEQYAQWYEKLIYAKTYSKNINDVLRRWKKLDFTVAIPFFLEVFHIWTEDIITEKDVVELLQYIESYLFRRIICDLPTNALNKIFIVLDRDITALDGSKQQYVEKLKYILENKKERTQFPTDTMFLECLTVKNIYAMSNKSKQYILERLENGNHLESKNIYEMLETGNCSIEHIMPQQLTPEWKTALGANWKIIHEVWLHRLANLTLTAYNSSYSNKTFQQKRDMEEIGLKNSGFRMNQIIAQKQKWTLQELEQRNEELKKTALQLWAFPKSNYQSFQQLLTAYTLEDDYCFTGKNILKFQFQGVEQTVKNWTDFFQKVLIMLHETDKTILNQLAEDKQNKELSLYVSRSKKSLQKKGYCVISSNIYVFVNTSTQHKINILRHFFQLYHIEMSELLFYLKEDKSNI
jgi:uncharacterized protein with ParB-like and HNH nuclease domain